MIISSRVCFLATERLSLIKSEAVRRLNLLDKGQHEGSPNGPRKSRPTLA